MTQPDSWERIFEAAQTAPGSTRQQPAKKTVQALKEEAEFARRRYSADVAVGLGAVDTGDDFDPWDWLAGFSSGITTSLTENTEAIANLAEITAASRSTQAYLANIQDMPTCPRRDLALFGYESQKWIDIDDGVYCAFDDHFHKVGLTCFRPEVVIGSTEGHIYYTPIIADRIGTLEGLRWFVGADASIFSIDYYEVALCIYNPTSGNLEKAWGSGNIKDGLPSTTSTAEAYIAFEFDPPQVSEPGQILFFAHQQIAPGALQASRRLAAALAPPAARAGQLLDASCYVAEDHSQGIPSSISYASLTRVNDRIPWGAVQVFATDPLE